MNPTVLDITADAYHADAIDGDNPYLSASLCNLILDASPAHARANHPKLNPNFERKSEDKFDLGTAVHSVLLEGVDRVFVIHHDSWRTKDAKESREYARAMGKIPLLAEQWQSVQPMFDAIRAQLAEYEVAPTPFTDGRAEQTLVWEESGVKCKARLDWLHLDCSAIDDFKSTKASARPAAWRKTMFGMGADVQCAFYLRGARAHGWDPAYRWVVVECEPPFALSVNTLDSAALAIADDKVDAAIATWRRCLQTDEWPSYTRALTRLEPMPWTEAQWMERREEMAA